MYICILFRSPQNTFIRGNLVHFMHTKSRWFDSILNLSLTANYCSLIICLFVLGCRLLSTVYVTNLYIITDIFDQWWPEVEGSFQEYTRHCQRIPSYLYTVSFTLLYSMVNKAKSSYFFIKPVFIHVYVLPGLFVSYLNSYDLYYRKLQNTTGYRIVVDKIQTHESKDASNLVNLNM